jgi:hypothetical protein
VFDIARGDTSGLVEVDTDEFSETRGVVVTDGFCIAECFQHGVGTDNLVFKGDLLLSWIYSSACVSSLLLTCTYGCKIRNDFFGVLSLAGSGLALKLGGLNLPQHKITVINMDWFS